MKVIDGTEYLTIGEVSRIIKRIPQTIVHWYVWKGENPDDPRAALLPEMYRFGGLNVRHFREEDVFKLEDFRDSIRYGDMAETSRRYWGTRGTNEPENTEIGQGVDRK